MDASNSAPLSIDNTAWANTVIASHATTLAVIVYTGPPDPICSLNIAVPIENRSPGV